MPRLDEVLVKKLGISRTSAKNLILEKKVRVKGIEQSLKPSSIISDDIHSDDIILDSDLVIYASRGAFKIEKATEVFGVSPKICLDIGASKGGFTDYLLRNGAELSIAVDSGTSQLDERLKDDPRVISIEQTKIQDLETDTLLEYLRGRKINFICSDVSFISVLKILDDIKRFIIGGACSDDVDIVLLIKPQFEMEGKKHFKNGVIKDRKIHKTVLNKCVLTFISSGFNVKGLDFSPIKGGDGNIEYLVWLRYTGINCNIISEMISEISLPEKLSKHCDLAQLERKIQEVITNAFKV